MEPQGDPFDYLDSHESCYMCNGFYGPNFSEPVCSTCHLFLFPDDLSHEQPDVVLSCIKDDGNDSGNDCDCPQDRDSSLKTPPLSCCSYNNLAGGINGPAGNGNRRGRERQRRREGEVEDEAESSDSLTSDEELLGAMAGPAHHYVFNVPGGGPDVGRGGAYERGGAYDREGAYDGRDGYPGGMARVDGYEEVREVYHRGGAFEGGGGGEGGNGNVMPQGLRDPDLQGQLVHPDEESDSGDQSPENLHNNPDEPALSRRIEELSSYNKAQPAPAANQNETGPSIHSLPPEVLIGVFSYLDDLSLCSAARTCAQWRGILHELISPERWRYFVLARFPLFTCRVNISDWYLVYAKLVENTPCYTCLQHMIRPQTSSPQEDTAWRHMRLHKEYNDIKLDPPDGIQAQPLDIRRCHWMATIAGPVASPYEGGVFYLYIRIPFSYPMHPPKVKFITRIFHPNVSRHGDVGIDCIQHNWSLALTLNKVLISVQSLLTDPYCLVCMEPSIGDLYVNNRLRFEEYARKWTQRYAMLDTVLH